MNKQQLIAALEAAKEYFEEMGSFGGKFGSQQGFHVAEAHRLNGVVGKAISLVNQLSEPAGWQPVPDFFKQIVRKLEFSANQCELWEDPEDVSIVAIEYRALAMKLEKWMEEHGK